MQLIQKQLPAFWLHELQPSLSPSLLSQTGRPPNQQKNLQTLSLVSTALPAAVAVAAAAAAAAVAAVAAVAAAVVVASVAKPPALASLEARRDPP